MVKTAWLTVNRSCNFRCRWCYGMASGFNDASDMSYKTAQNIVLLLKKVGVTSVFLIGGEPTMWKSLFKFNDFCNELSLKTTLVTNAYKFHSRQFWLEYLKHPNSRIGVSLKSYDEKSHLRITKSADFEGVRVGIQRVTAKYKSSLSLVYSTLIEGHLLEAVSTAIDMGAASVHISPCTPMSINGTFTAPFTVDYSQMVREITTSYRKMVAITNNRISFSLKTPLCIWPKDFIQNLITQKQLTTVCQFQQRAGIVFDTCGSVVLCNSMFDCPVGQYGIDFKNGKSLLALLKGKKVDSIYRHVNSYPSKKCIGCSYFNRCRGGCPIMWTVRDPNTFVRPINSKGDSNA